MNKFTVLLFVIGLVMLSACASAPNSYTDNLPPVAPTTESTAAPTNSPTQQAPTQPARVPTPINVDEIVAIRATTRTVSEMLSELDENFNDHWYQEVSGAWGSREATAGYIIVGPALFWTDLFDNSLTSGTTRVRTQGGWGIYHIAPDATFRIPSNNGGGRWIKLSARLSGTLACLSDFSHVVAGEAKNALESVTFMDAHTNASTSYTHGSVTVPNNSVMVVWADWHGDPPATFFPLTTYSTEGGYGVWVTTTSQTFQMPQGGGGTTILENCF